MMIRCTSLSSNVVSVCFDDWTTIQITTCVNLIFLSICQTLSNQNSFKNQVNINNPFLVVHFSHRSCKTPALNRLMVRVGSRIGRLWFNLGIAVAVPAMLLAPVLLVVNIAQFVQSYRTFEGDADASEVR